MRLLYGLSNGSCRKFQHPFCLPGFRCLSRNCSGTLFFFYLYSRRYSF
jgi:hypothetical protein